MKFVAYFRVSTDRQGRSGLGLEAQREAVLRHLQGKGEIAQEFTEIESGRNNARPQLAEALRICRVQGWTLVVAKLDRLSRNAHFLTGLLEAGVPIEFCDMPNVDRAMLQMAAVWAEMEARMISQRTKAALQAARARGKKLGGQRVTDERAREILNAARPAGTRVLKERADARARDYGEIIAELEGGEILTYSEIARRLNARGVPMPSGKVNWRASNVSRIMARKAQEQQRKAAEAARVLKEVAKTTTRRQHAARAAQGAGKTLLRATIAA